MAFFAGASNVSIFGGSFINNEAQGKLTFNDHTQYNTNINSNNKSTNNVINSHNDNSSRISGNGGQTPSMPPRSAGHREEDHTQSQPQQPRYGPPRIPSTGGTATNLDSFNVENTSVNNAFNNNSHNYYRGGAPPNNSRQNNGSQWMSGPDQGPPSTIGAHRSGQFPAPLQSPFHAPFPQQMGVGGPHTSVIDANIQPLGQQMGQDFGKWLNTTISQAQSIAAGTSGGKHDPQAAYSSLSRNVDDSMNTGMASLSLNDHHPQIPTYLSPPNRLSSDRQVGLKPTDQLGSSNGNLGPYNSAAQHGSHLTSSLARRMNEPEMANIFSPPTETRPSHGNNLNRPPPPASTSPFNHQPSLNVGPNSNFIKHDRSVHNMNLDSFNEHNNTLRDSYNDNSLVDSTGNHSADDHSNRVDEEPPLEETDEHIPTAAESNVDSLGKKKKRFQIFRKK